MHPTHSNEQVATYTISELAAEFGLTLRTLRFWESRGLIKPMRSGNIRVYSQSDRSELAQIVIWREQRFTVEEIKTALQSGGFTRQDLAEQVEYLCTERAEIDRAIADLRALLGSADRSPSIVSSAALNSRGD
jgi:DNA-binding transcriptional MerR regulator